MTKKTDTVVIGAGPGGYVAAIRAAQLGQKVTVVEAEHIGGVCLNVGCIPSKALITAGHRYQEAQHSDFLGLSVKEAQLDFTKTQQWKDQQVVKTLTSGVGMLLKKNGAEVIMGRATFTGPQSMTITTKNGEEKLEFKHAIVATGSRPIEIPGFAFAGRVLDLGGAYRNLGSEVTIIEGSPNIVPNFESDISELVAKRFKQNGVEVFTNAKAKKAVETTNGVAVEFEVKGKTQMIEADYVMVTVGRRPNTENLGLEKAGVKLTERNLVKVDEQYRTSQKNIFAIGDIVEGLALAHKASYEAKVAAEVIGGKNVAKDYRNLFYRSRSSNSRLYVGRSQSGRDQS